MGVPFRVTVKASFRSLNVPVDKASAAWAATSSTPVTANTINPRGILPDTQCSRFKRSAPCRGRICFKYTGKLMIFLTPPAKTPNI